MARTGRHSAAWLAHDALLAQTLGIFGADRYVPGPALSVSLSASGPPAPPKPGSRRITVPPASSAAESVKVSSSKGSNGHEHMDGYGHEQHRGSPGSHPG